MYGYWKKPDSRILGKTKTRKWNVVELELTNVSAQAKVNGETIIARVCVMAPM